MVMTQAEYDNKVNSIAEHEVRLAYKASILRKQSDPAMFRREEELVFLQNVLYAISYYDISQGLFTDDEIRDLFALAMQVIQKYPS